MITTHKATKNVLVLEFTTSLAKYLNKKISLSQKEYWYLDRNGYRMTGYFMHMRGDLHTRNFQYLTQMDPIL